MASEVDEKSQHVPPHKAHHRFSHISQICLRLMAIAATLAATWIMFTNKETAVVFGTEITARYSYSPAFKFFTYANLIACAFSVVTLLLTIFVQKSAMGPAYYFCFFLHDLCITLLLMSGCAAATAIGYVGKHGNSHTGWMAVCGHVQKFCNKSTEAATLSYLGLFFYIILTIMSANKPRRINV